MVIVLLGDRRRGARWRRRRRALAAPVARRGLGDRRRRGRSCCWPTPSPTVRSIVPADCRWSPRSSLALCGVPCAATLRGVPGAARDRPRAGDHGGPGRDRRDDRARGPGAGQHGPRTRGHGTLALRPLGRRRATRAPGADRAGIPPASRHGDQASTALKVDAATVDLRHPAAGPRSDRPRGHRRGRRRRAPGGARPRRTEQVALDRRWIIEVVRQLVDNAAKFSPPERADPGDAPGSTTAAATIEVIDEGPGIPAERRDDVFDKYPNWRPDGYEQAAGSGLGLFLVRGIVARTRRGG